MVQLTSVLLASAVFAATSKMSATSSSPGFHSDKMTQRHAELKKALGIDRIQEQQRLDDNFNEQSQKFSSNEISSHKMFEVSHLTTIDLDPSDEENAYVRSLYCNDNQEDSGRYYSARKYGVCRISGLDATDDVSETSVFVKVLSTTPGTNTDTTDVRVQRFICMSTDCTNCVEHEDGPQIENWTTNIQVAEELCAANSPQTHRFTAISSVSLESTFTHGTDLFVYQYYKSALAMAYCKDAQRTGLTNGFYEAPGMIERYIFPMNECK